MIEPSEDDIRVDAIIPRHICMDPFFRPVSRDMRRIETERLPRLIGIDYEKCPRDGKFLRSKSASSLPEDIITFVFSGFSVPLFRLGGRNVEIKARAIKNLENRYFKGIERMKY